MRGAREASKKVESEIENVSKETVKDKENSDVEFNVEFGGDSVEVKIESESTGNEDLNKDKLKDKLKVEAILFATPEPISVSKIARLSKIKGSEVRKLIEELIADYSARNTAIEIIEVGGKYSMRVKPEYHSYVERLILKDMEKGVLRTLAVIALKQPIKLSELAKLRGNRCYEHVKKLEEMELINSEKRGRTKVLTTTKKFAEYFGLRSSSPESVKEFLKRAKDSTLNKALKKYINDKP